MDMKGIALGLAIAGVATVGFTGVASAYEAPAEVAAVTILCWDAGYHHADCHDAVRVAVDAGEIDRVNAGLEAAGIDHRVGYDHEIIHLD